MLGCFLFGFVALFVCLIGAVLIVSWFGLFRMFCCFGVGIVKCLLFAMHMVAVGWLFVAFALLLFVGL